MNLRKKSSIRRGFTLAELLIVVAIIAVLAGIAFVFVQPRDISYIEYNRSAEAIATAAQNRLTEIRNTGDMAVLKTLGEQSSEKYSGTITPTEAADPAEGEDKTGGYRYVFNFGKDKDGKYKKGGTGMQYILPFGAIDSDLADGYYAIGFQSDTGMVGEAFYCKNPFECTVSYLLEIQGDEAKRKEAEIGYYQGTVDEQEVAFAQLPTPQITITNYEELTLSIYLPEVKQLKNKTLGIRVSLADEKGEVYTMKNALSLDDTAIYYTYGKNTETDITTSAVVTPQDDITTGNTYSLILDTPQSCNHTSMAQKLGSNDIFANGTLPKGKFEDWAQKTKAYRAVRNSGQDKYFELGDNVKVTVTVFCLLSGAKAEDAFPIDPTYMARTGTAVFNGWFDTYNGGSKVTIACGRHLQNLGKLAEPNPDLEAYLPKVKKEGGKYTYSDYSRGLAYYYTDKSDEGEKFTYRVKGGSHIVQDSINVAEQVKAIDFACAEWKDKDFKEGDNAQNVNGLLSFEPINLPRGFSYRGNYLPIRHLYVDAPLYAGLFGFVYHASLYDVLLVNPSVTSHAPAYVAEIYEMGAGALVGTSRSSNNIRNCQTYMEPENGKYNSDYRVIGNCYVGGLIGLCENESIRENSASVYTGNKAGSSLYVGGLVGAIMGNSSITGSYGAGNLSGQYVGGLVGALLADSYGADDMYRISGCYSAGHIEEATKSASGLIGCLNEQKGYNRSALGAHDNYCIVVYGKSADGGKTYTWDSQIKEWERDENGYFVEKVSGAAAAEDNKTPIYGTFEGDGFEWLDSSDTSNLVGDKGLFIGSEFSYDNRNYYIPQKDIEYQNSEYYEKLAVLTENFEAELETFIKDESSTLKDADIIQKIEDYRIKIRYQKQLLSLEAIKEGYESLLDELSQETATFKDKNGEERAYRDGCTLYIGKNDSDVHSSSGSSYTEALTLYQAIQALYNKKYTKTTTDESGNVTTTETNAGLTYYFTDLYQKAKEALEKLIQGTGNDSDKTTVETILGKDDNYANGTLYLNCLNEVEDALDKTKDYFCDSHNEGVEGGQEIQPGRQLFYYYRDWVCNRDLIGWLMSCTTKESVLEENLQAQKEELLKPVEEELEKLNGILDETKNFWKEADKMGPYRDLVKTLADKAADAIDALKACLAGVKSESGTTTPEAMQQAIDDAYAYFNDLCHIFDGDNSKFDEDEDDTLIELSAQSVEALLSATVSGGTQKMLDVNADQTAAVIHTGVKDKEGEEITLEVKLVYDKARVTYYLVGGVKDAADVIDSEGNTGDPNSSTHKGMRDIRDSLNDVRSNILYMGAELNSGTESVMDRLEYYLNLDLENIPKEDYEKYNNTKLLIQEAVEDLKEILGSEWEQNDSGRRVYSAFELRMLILRNALDGDFEYDYGEVKGYEKYNVNNTFFDLDNGITNNLFPYLENKYTKYFPFPMTTGVSLQSSGSRATGVLFQYGDWLTDDLWAEDPADKTGDKHIEHKYHVGGAFSGTLSYLKDLLDLIKDLSAPSSSFWTKTEMKNYKSMIYTLITNLQEKMEELITAVRAYEEDPTTEKLKPVQEKLPIVQALYKDLYKIFDKSSSSSFDFSKETSEVIDGMTDKPDDSYVHRHSGSDAGIYQMKKGLKDIVDAIDKKGRTITKEQNSNYCGMRMLRELLGGGNGDTLSQYTIEMLKETVPLRDGEVVTA